MKKRFIVALLAAAGAALFAAACNEADHVIGSEPAPVVQGNGNVVEHERAVGGFGAVEHRGVGMLYIVQGAREELRVRAEENLIEHLKTEVQGGRLTISKDGATLLNSAPIEYHLTVVDLEHLALTGAGGIEGSSLDSGPLAIRLSGVGGIEIADLNATRLDIEGSGMGAVRLSGAAQEQTIRMSGMSHHDGRDLSSAVTDVRVSQSGSATVRVRDHLSVTINGSGNVYYIGDPVVNSSVNGTGQLVHLDG